MGILQDNFKKLETYIFENSEREKLATSELADIIGVLADIKPAALIGAPKKITEYEELYLFKEQLKEVGLTVIGSHHDSMRNGEVIIVHDFFISKDIKKAQQLYEDFNAMWATMDDYSEIFDQKKWQDISRRIGMELGYPETAVEYFAKRNDDVVDDAENVARMERNRYYAHSPENEEQEYQSYDKLLNQAIEQWSPRTAEILKQDDKRW